MTVSRQIVNVLYEWEVSVDAEYGPRKITQLYDTWWASRMGCEGYWRGSLVTYFLSV